MTVSSRPFGSKRHQQSNCSEPTCWSRGVHGTAAIHEPRVASTTTREGMGKQRPLDQLRLLGVVDQP